MATFYIDNTTPQPQAAPASRAGGNFLSGLSQLAEAKQRGRYYDYLANVQEQKAGQQKENDRKAALLQQEDNKQLKPLHDQYRTLISRNNKAASEAMATLDRFLMGAANQTAANTVEDRLKAFTKYLNDNPDDNRLSVALSSSPDGKINEDLRKNLLERFLPKIRMAAATAGNALKNSDAFINAMEDPRMFKGQSVKFINENGVVDYRFVPRNDAITYYGTRYGEDFKTGNPLDARSEAPAPAVEAEPQSLSEVARRQATLTSPEYVTNVGPAVGGPILPPVEPAQPVVTEPAPAALTQPPVVPAPAPQAMQMQAPAAIPVQQVAPTPAPAPAPVISPPVAPVSPAPITSQSPFPDLPSGVIGYVDDDGNIIERSPNPNEIVDPFSPEAMAENERQSNIRYYKDRLSKINQIIDDKYRQSWIDPDTKEKFPSKIVWDKDKDLARSLGYRPYGVQSIYGSKMDPNFIMPFTNIKAYEEERDMLQGLLEDALSRENVTRPAPVVIPEGPEPMGSPLNSYLRPIQQTNQLPVVSPQVAPVGVQGNTPMRLDQLSPLMNE